MSENIHPPSFTQFTDLAAARLGGKVLYANDEFFADKENLIQDGRGIFIPDKYTDHGKWMDGWESRRKRKPGHDWCILKLAETGRIRGFDIDTNHFLGNQPVSASIDGAYLDEQPDKIMILNGQIDWEEILPNSILNPGSQHFFEISNQKLWTHLRFNIYPDGGVARLRAYGEVVKDWSNYKSGELIDLAAALNGGRTLSCNDMFFSNMQNIIMPGVGRNMGDGWETRRSRKPNNCDWLIIQLARPGHIGKILVDTLNFKGNYPDQCSLDGCLHSEGAFDPENIKWVSLLPKSKLEADEEHIFEREILAHDRISHVRFNIYPDGGVSRLRVFGTIS